VSGLRTVVIGAAAHVFALHRPGLRAIDAEIVGVQDVDPGRANQVAEELGCPAFADVDRLLQTPADLAVITSPHPFHAEQATACLRAGLHVLVEKPIAVHIGEADGLVDEAERSGRQLAVAFQQRTRREVQAARRLIQSGALGVLQRADLLASWPRRTSYFQSAPWRATWAGEGGGVLINQGQHDLDVLGYLMGQPGRVVGWTRTRLHPIETEDTAAALLEWSNGAIGSVRLSTCEADEPQRIEITGTAGRLRLQMGRLEIFQNEVDFREHVVSEGSPYAPPASQQLPAVTGEAVTHLDLYLDLARALDQGGEPIAPAREAALTLELANAIICSAATGAEVELPLDRAGYRALLASLRAGQRPTRAKHQG
jgi:predicted dehydrogenase